MLIREDVQSVLFDTSKWSVDSAKDWLKSHGYKSGDVDKKSKWLHFRQNDPKKYSRYATSGKGSSQAGLKKLGDKGIIFRMGYV